MEVGRERKKKGDRERGRNGERNTDRKKNYEKSRA